MKKLFFLALLVLPIMLYSATPSCVSGMEVSLIDANGKVFKSGKFDSKGELTLDGLEDVAYTIRLSNNGKACDLNKPKSGSFSGLPTGKRMHKPFIFKISDQQGGISVLPAPNEKAPSRSDGGIEHMDDWTKASKKKQNTGASDNGGVDDDCDGVGISVTVAGNGGGAGKATFKEFTITK